MRALSAAVSLSCPSTSLRQMLLKSVFSLVHPTHVLRSLKRCAVRAMDVLLTRVDVPGIGGRGGRQQRRVAADDEGL